MALNRDFPLSPTPGEAVTDSVDVAKEKSGTYAKKGFDAQTKFFNKKNYTGLDVSNFTKNRDALADSVDKYSEKVFGATKNMSKSDLASKGVKRTISPKGDTTMNYSSKGITFTRKYYNKKK
jgi:hypothetical protein